MVDATITVLRERGFDLTKPDLSTRSMSRDEEIETEAMVTGRAALIINGHGTCESYFDRFLSGHTTLTGTIYDVQHGRVCRHDFSVSTITQRTREGHLVATLLPSVLGVDNSEPSIIEGKNLCS